MESKENMAELENLLLQAAGRNNTSTIDEKRTKKRTRPSFSESNENSTEQKNPPLSHSHFSVRNNALNINPPTKKICQRSSSRSIVDLSESDDNSDDLLASKSRPVTYEDVKEITICRSKLAKWFMEPFFEQIIVGCFVRIGIGKTRTGPKYKLCVVKNVDSTDPNRQYKLEDRYTAKYLNCVWGSESSAARWQMAVVSNSPPTEAEFKEWVQEMERNKRDILCCQDVEDKLEEIQKAFTAYVYSAETVKEMVQHKKSVSSRPINFAEQKVHLREEIAAAECVGRKAEVVRLQAKFKEIDELSKKIKPGEERALRLWEMSRKNMKENYKKASEMKPIDRSLAAGESGYDPCSRRWTRSTIAIHVDGELGEGKTGNITNVDALQKEEERKSVDDVISPRVDHGAELRSMHDFDLPISLRGLIRFREAHGAYYRGLMERKRMIEASIENKVPEHYQRRRTNNVLTLSIEDYKRRKSLP